MLSNVFSMDQLDRFKASCPFKMMRVLLLAPYKNTAHLHGCTTRVSIYNTLDKQLAF